MQTDHEPTNRYCLTLDPHLSVLIINTVFKSRFRQKTECNPDGSRGVNVGTIYIKFGES